MEQFPRKPASGTIEKQIRVALAIVFSDANFLRPPRLGCQGDNRDARTAAALSCQRLTAGFLLPWTRFFRRIESKRLLSRAQSTPEFHFKPAPSRHASRSL